jgi:hypothetical protein
VAETQITHAAIDPRRAASVLDGQADPSALSVDDQRHGLAETRRVEGLSDAAFSIIITLLVLEIHRPDVAQGELGKEL